jgi:hypothetical protein
MMTKRKLSLDALRVESFDTGAAPDERGTVHAHADADGCTCAKSCLCPTAYYHCGDGPHTIHSCDYSQNASCGYDTSKGCDTWQYDCA